VTPRSAPVKVTCSGAMVLASALLLCTLAAATHRHLCWVLCWATVGTLVASHLLARRALAGVGLDLLDCTARLFEGRPGKATVRVRNDSGVAKANLLLDLNLYNETRRSHFTESCHLTRLDPGATLTETVSIRGLRRGVVKLHTAALAGSDPLGLFVCSVRSTNLDRRLRVYPRRVPARLPCRFTAPICLRPMVSEQSTGLGDTEVRAVRPYVHGDPLRRVHWPLTARAGEMIVKEVEGAEESGAAIFVDLSCEQLGGAHGGAEFEANLRVALAVVEELTRSGGTVTVRLGAGPALELRGTTGDGEHDRLLHRLAEAQPTFESRPDRLVLAGGRPPKGGTVLVITAELTPELIRVARLLRAVRSTLVVAHTVCEAPVPLLPVEVVAERIGAWWRAAWLWNPKSRILGPVVESLRNLLRDLEPPEDVRLPDPEDEIQRTLQAAGAVLWHIPVEPETPVPNERRAGLTEPWAPVSEWLDRPLYGPVADWQRSWAPTSLDSSRPGLLHAFREFLGFDLEGGPWEPETTDTLHTAVEGGKGHLRLVPRDS